MPGAIRIRAVRMRSRRATRPPIIGLTGGPGQAGVIYAAGYDYILPTAGRDLILFDQRGTGASGLLRCRSLEGRSSGGFSRAAGACGRSIGKRRSYYTSVDSALDIEALRIRLGVPRIALFSVSYGSRVAVEYARRYPERVERMVLDSPLGLHAPDSLALETLSAVGRVLRTICRSGCGGAEEHPVADLERLVPRLRRSPIRLVVRRGGRRVPVTVGADDLLGMLVSSDLDPSFMRRIPPAVRAAVGGNVAPLVRLKASIYGTGEGGGSREPVSQFSPAVYAATTCEDATLVWDAAAAPATRRSQARAAVDDLPAYVFSPFDGRAALNFGLLPLCAEWPARERVFDVPPPLPTTVPSLILSGDLDLRTPLENAQRLARALGGKVLIERGTGHAVLGRDLNGCATAAVKAFLDLQRQPQCRREGSISIEPGARRAAAPRLGL